MISQVRGALRHLFVYTLYASGALARAKKDLGARGGIVVVTLHRVLPDEESKNTLSPPGMVMSERTFDRLVKYLCCEHQIVPLGGSDKHSNSHRVSVAITFDDGWDDNAKHAQPILSQYRAPATIFLCPGKIGQKFPFWPERLTAMYRTATQNQQRRKFMDMVAKQVVLPRNARLPHVIDALKRLPPKTRDSLLQHLQQVYFSQDFQTAHTEDSTMTWETARQLSIAGMVFGSHTLHHEILTSLPSQELAEEIEGSRERVVAEIGQPCWAFAYPNGDWCPKIRDLTASAGYTAAFARGPGVWSAQTDPFVIPRINLWEGAVTGIHGRFSRPHFDYVVFWKSRRGLQN